MQRLMLAFFIRSDNCIDENTIVLLRNETKWLLGNQKKRMKQVPIGLLCEEKVTAETCQSQLQQPT